MLHDYLIALLDWCKIKIFLATKTNAPLFKEGEIWWCHIGINLGVEIFGKGPQLSRPVLIFKKLSTTSFLAIPLTTQPKIGNWYVPIHSGKNGAKTNFGQIRVLDSKRLMRRITVLGDDDFQKIKVAFLNVYGV
jgi:mRNA interferase MazF